MRKRRKYIVNLTDEQRNELNSLINKGEHSSRKIKRAQILLASDQQKEGKEIAKYVGVVPHTVYKVCERFIQEGLEAALNLLSQLLVRNHQKVESAGLCR